MTFVECRRYDYKETKTQENEGQCNDKGSRDDYLITLNVMRERRELDRVSWWIVLPTYTLFLFVYVYA